MAVLSNKPVHPSRAIVEALGLGKFFALVYGGNSFATKKPDPEGAQTILRETGFGAPGNPDRGRLRRGRPDRSQCRDLDMRRDLRLRPAYPAATLPRMSWSIARRELAELFASITRFLTPCPQCPPWLTLFRP